MICTPGAEMSGLMKSLSGPRDENDAISSPSAGPSVPAAHVAMTPVWVETKVWTASELKLTWIAGRKWLSDSRSVTTADSLYRIMPAAPPWETL